MVNKNKRLFPFLINLILSLYFLTVLPLLLRNHPERKRQFATAEQLPILGQNTASSWQEDGKKLIHLVDSGPTVGELKKISMALVDTGIDPAHPFFQDSLYVPHKQVSQLIYGIDFTKMIKVAPEDKKEKKGIFDGASNSGITWTPFDEHGHGTHVAGIIKNINPRISFLVLKYFNPKAGGETNLTATLKALEFAVAANVDIINYSGGGPEPSTLELQLLKEAQRKGILVVAAAGNEKVDLDSPKHTYFPASYGLSNIISVSALDEKNQILKSANWGKNVIDLLAPGKNIRSTLPRGRFGQMTGTSQATAFVSGVASLIKERFPNFSPEEIKLILSTSVKKSNLLRNKCKTQGFLDADRAMKMAIEFNHKNYRQKLTAPTRTFANAISQ